MRVTFDTLNENEVNEVVALLQNMGMVRVSEAEVAVKPTETVVEDTKEVEVIPEVPQEEKETVAPPKEKKTRAPKTTKPSIGLAELKELAKDAVEHSDRPTVKATISEYGDKLTDVATKDYDALAEKLTALKG